MTEYTQLVEILSFAVGMVAGYAALWYVSGYQNLPVLTDEVVAMIVESRHDPQAAAAYLAQEPLWPVVLMCLVSFKSFLKVYPLALWVLPIGIPYQVPITCFVIFMGPTFGILGSKRNPFKPFSSSVPPEAPASVQDLSAAASEAVAAAQALSEAAAEAAASAQALSVALEAAASAQVLSSSSPEAAATAQVLFSTASNTVSAVQSLFSADLPLFEIHPLQWWLFFPSTACTICLVWKLGKVLFPNQ
jgi:hypothetical protein